MQMPAFWMRFFRAVGRLCLFYECSKSLTVPWVSENVSVSCVCCVTDRVQMISSVMLHSFYEILREIWTFVSPNRSPPTLQSSNTVKNHYLIFLKLEFWELYWWSSGSDSKLPRQGARVPALVRQLDPTCPRTCSWAAAGDRACCRED